MASKPRSKKTQNIDVSFTHGIADKWAFDFPPAFRPNIDISCFNYVDKLKTAELLRDEGHKRINGKPRLSILRKIWTRRVPPVRSFEEGHVFYDPPGVRQMVWGDALKVLRRVVQIHEAKPDTRGGSEGWVSFLIYYYEDAQVIATEKKTCSQGNFEAFLRSGKLADS